jgi:hypothetical protein
MRDATLNRKDLINCFELESANGRMGKSYANASSSCKQYIIGWP